jgi:hypothetical protein
MISFFFFPRLFFQKKGDHRGGRFCGLCGGRDDLWRIGKAN